MVLNFNLLKMKKIKYRLYFLWCPIFLLWSCETVVEVELPEHEPRLVINAVFNPDSLFTVDVSASRNVFSYDAHLAVEDARVSLYGPEKHLLDLQHVGNGIYQADQKPQALQYYELRVNAPGYPDASAASYVPTEPDISNVKAEVGPVHYDWQGPTVNASFTLADPAEEENFYYLRVFSPDTTFDEIPYERYVNIVSSTPIEFEFDMETRLFFSDRLFNGQALHLRLNLENHPDHITYVQVAHITKEYYQYVRSLEKQSYNETINLTPIPVSNNVLNGMGLFGGCNTRTLFIKP